MGLTCTVPSSPLCSALVFLSVSSFDEYSSELKSGRLEWSPVHKSEKFWRENAGRLNEKNYELLKYDSFALLVKQLFCFKCPTVPNARHPLFQFGRSCVTTSNMCDICVQYQTKA